VWAKIKLLSLIAKVKKRLVERVKYSSRGGRGYYSNIQQGWFRCLIKGVQRGDSFLGAIEQL
jgi:hypothetical protein